MSMPPFPMWLRGADEYAAWMRGPGSECRGSRLAAISVNGTPGFAQWRVNPSGGYDAWAIHVLQVSGGRIAGFDFFVDASLFPLFGLSIHLDA
jgi:RNA polymerase sigma-70 factor (ECF subfamily)